MSKRKKLDKKEKESKRNKAKDRLVVAKEKLTKVKNKELELDIEKEDKVLDVAKGLALAKEASHISARMNEKDEKTDALKKETRKADELKQKQLMSVARYKVNKKQLEYLTKMSEEKRYDAAPG